MSKRLLVLIVGVAAVLGVTAAIALIAGGGGHQTYQNPSESMEPTITAGQSLDVNEEAYSDSVPQTGDIVVFWGPHGAVKPPECGDPSTGAGGNSGAACDQPTPERADVKFVKRIVAGPGDTLSIESGHPVVNGVIAQEDFVGHVVPVEPATCRNRSPSRPTITS